MPIATFHASPAHPVYFHRNAGWQEKSDGVGGTYRILVPPLYLNDGDSVEVDSEMAAWMADRHPDLFTFADAAAEETPTPE